jgi:hypothetical protein
MGGGPSILSGTSETSENKSSNLNNVKFAPAGDFLNYLKIAQGLTDKYQEHDAREVVKFISENNKNGVITPITDDLKKQIAKYYEEFDKHLASNVNYQNKSQIDKIKYKTEQLSYPKFYELLKDIKNKHFEEARNKIIESPLIKSNGEHVKSVSTIFDNIAAMRAKEQFYKHEYIITQIWMLSYLQNLNAGVTKFITDTMKLVKENEEIRNRYAQEMIANIFKILNQTDGNITDVDFQFFRDQLKIFQEKTNKSTEELNKSVTQASTQLQGVTGQSPATGVAQGPARGGKSKKNKKSTQKGGFVRDHSRFPQSFYELSNV